MAHVKLTEENLPVVADEHGVDLIEMRKAFFIAQVYGMRQFHMYGDDVTFSVDLKN